MTTDELFSKLQNMLTEILIDVRFNFMYHENWKPEDYYEKDFVEGVTILEETNDPDTDTNVYIETTKSDKVWTAIFNGLPKAGFMANLQRLSNELVSEYFVEQKITKYIGPTEFTPEAYFELIGNVYKQILYDKGENRYKMANVKYTSTFERYNFPSRNMYELQEFYKELKNTCHDLLIIATDRFETNSSNLSWHKKKIDLIELIVALVENNAVRTFDNKDDRNLIIRRFEQIFAIDLRNADSLLSHKNYNASEPGKFLKSLVDTYREYTEEKLNKKRST